MKPTMTTALARAIGHNAATKRMRKAGRSTWNRADYALAVRVMAKLLEQFNLLPR